MAAERGRVEPAPRRVRGYVDGVLVFDTVAARYVWEVPYYPQYYVPVKDVRTQYLVDEDHARRLQFGTSRSHALHVNGVTIAEAVRVFGDDALPGIADTARFAWDAVDWFEEDERIVGGHPRNPYARVDALRSHRHVRVELDGVVLADTHAPGAAVRDRAADAVLHRPHRRRVRAPHRLGHPDGLPVQGRDVGLLVGAGRRYACMPDVAWTYQYPDRSVAAIAGMVAFYNEQVDVVVDGTPLPRPRTHFVR